MVHLADEPHVAEDAGVAREIHGEAVLESNDVAGGHAQIDGPALFGHRAAVDRGHHRHRQAGDVQRAAGVHPGHPLKSFALQPDGYFVRGDVVRAARARQRDGVAGVILMSVRNQHQVERTELVRRLRTGWIARDPWVEHDALATRRDEQKRRVPEPGKGERAHLS